MKNGRTFDLRLSVSLSIIPNSLLVRFALKACANSQAIGGCTYATVFSSRKWRKIKTRIPTGWRITVITLQ